MLTPGVDILESLSTDVDPVQSHVQDHSGICGHFSMPFSLNDCHVPILSST